MFYPGLQDGSYLRILYCSFGKNTLHTLHIGLCVIHSVRYIERATVKIFAMWLNGRQSVKVINTTLNSGPHNLNGVAPSGASFNRVIIATELPKVLVNQLTNI